MTADVTILEDPVLFLRYYKRMPESRRSRIDAFRFEKDKRLSLGVGILLEKALNAAGYAGPMPDAGAGPHGKPYFPEIAGRFQFNLSHSGTKVMCVSAVSADAVPEVGCDVETGESVRGDWTALAERFFTAEENAYLLGGNDPEARETRFRRLWTLKESFIKATGEGLSRRLDSFSIGFKEDGGIFVDGTEDGQRFRFDTWQPADGAVYSWCAGSTGGEEPDVVTLQDDHQTWGI